MIRVVTEENFSLLDAQIEQAYRRRRNCPDRGLSRAVLRIVANDIALLEAVRSAQGQVDQVDYDAMWLMRLESNLANLSREASSRLCPAAPANGGCAYAPEGRRTRRMVNAIERRRHRGAAKLVVANGKRTLKRTLASSGSR